ncbi:hypothetical protein GO988_00830 [Hymenobacter sp. HMF4947]|uniref:Uncharacterized protein n=1 Tax=Hymenobacter ginkgonis TaxID=2682976 RepID=A0A7K1T989_9BACT|nr:hypothetical protein [Hymenobacter ginkgonis]MVN74862.1 hypothetical protein [Hymenobacter ginkgonis]
MTIPPPTLKQVIDFVLLMLTVVGGAVIGAVQYRRLPQNLRYLAWLAWFELPLELLGSALGFLHHNNLFIMPFYTVGELALLALVYRSTLQSAAFNRALPWLVGGFTAYTVLDSLLAADLTSWFRPGQQVIQSLLILGMVSLYFRKLLRELLVRHLEREPMFWVSVGLALYFVGYLQIALFSNYMLKHYSLQFNRNIWNINFGLTLVLHSCYCWALGRRGQPTAPAWPTEVG